MGWMASVGTHIAGQVTYLQIAEFFAKRLTSDDKLVRIADFPEVPVSLENCRQLDPQTHIDMLRRLDVSPAETPR